MLASFDHRDLRRPVATNCGRLLACASIGFFVLSASAPSAVASVLFAGTCQGKLYSSNLDGSNRQTVLNNPGVCFGSIAPDDTSGKLYVADRPDRIVRVNADGTGLTTVIGGLSNVFDVAIDPVGGKLYWLDLGPGIIRRANLDGSGIQDVVTGFTPENAAGFDLDLVNGKIYWSDSQNVFGIRRANLDGSGVQSLFNFSFWSLSLDEADGKIFGSSNNSLYSTNMSGSGSVSTLLATSDTIYDMYSDDAANKIYFTQPNSSPAGSVRRVNSDGTGNQLLYTDPAGGQTAGIAVSTPVPEPGTLSLMLAGGVLAFGAMVRRRRERSSSVGQ